MPPPIVPTYTQRFGGNTVYPSEPSFISITTAIDITLSWPIEQATPGQNIIAEITEVTATAGGVDISLSDARQVSEGYTSLFNNIGSNTFTVKDTGGNTLLSVASGEVWQLYLADNSTANGVWRIFQYGAGSSSANAAALAGAGLKAITTTLNQKMAVNEQSVNYALLDSDRAKAVIWIGGGGTFTLPDPATVGSDWFVMIRNAGSGNLTVTPAAGTIDGGANKLFSQTNSAIVVSDGVNYFTIGFGQAINTVFDFITIDVSGAGDYTLSGGELNRVAYEFHGIITANRNIIVPTVIQQYWCDNETTGAFDLEVKTALGTGVIVPQGSRTILYCDGTNVVHAETVVATVPVLISQGGTSATTITGAQANLQVPPTSRTISAGVGLTGGGDLSANRTIALDTTNTRNVDHATVTISAGVGLTGGGDITASRSIALDTTNTRNVDHATVSISAGTGLTGGGDITTSRTLSVNTAASFTWTGVHNFSNEVFFGPVGAAESVHIAGAANQYSIVIAASTTSSQSFGMLLDAGTSASDITLRIRDATGAVDRFEIFGDGGVVVGNATGGNQGFGTLNANGLFVDGAAVLTSASFPKVAYGNITGATAVVTDSAGITSASRTSAGQWTVDITAAGFTTTPVVTGTDRNTGGSNGDLRATATSNVSITVTSKNDGGTFTDTNFGLIIVGS